MPRKKKNRFEIDERKVGFRIGSVRAILKLSLYEFARLIEKSHNTLNLTERGHRPPATEMVKNVIKVAKEHDLEISEAWVWGKTDSPPVAKDVDLQKRIEVEQKIEPCMIKDSFVDKAHFADRLRILMEKMGLSAYKFAVWSGSSAHTVNMWARGKTVPKRDTFRVIVKKIIEENVPVSLEWLLEGRGEPPTVKFVITPDKLQANDPDMIYLDVNTVDFEPHVKKNTRLFAHPYDSKCFVSGWTGLYLYKHKTDWLPVRMQGTKDLKIFNVISAHSRIEDQLILTNVKCPIVFPVLYYEAKYPIALRNIKKVSVANG